MNIKPKNNLQNHLTFTEAFNKIERKATDKFEHNLYSYIKDANSTLDNIYVYNTLFNPFYTLKFLNNKKFTKTFINKKKSQIFNSHALLNEVKKDKNNNIKKGNLKSHSRNRTLNYLGKFNSYDAIMNVTKNKNMSNLLNKINNNNNSNEKHVKFSYNTINNFSRKSISNQIDNIKLDKEKNNSNKNLDDIKNIINDINIDDINSKISTIQINRNDPPDAGSKEDEKLLKALHRNKFHLLKYHKKKFIKEMKKEKKIKIIDEDIESKENSLFQKEEQKQIKPDLMKIISDNKKNNNMRLNKTEKNLLNNKIDNQAKPKKLNKTLNTKNENENDNKKEQKSLDKNIIDVNNSEKAMKNIENNDNQPNNNANPNNLNSNIKKDDENEDSSNNKKEDDNDNDNENEDDISNNKKKEDNLKSSSSNNKKIVQNKSGNNFKKLAKINYSIYLDCIKNIKQNQNFPNILKYVDKQRLSQYKINNLKSKIKSEEDILYPNKQLLKNQDKEVNFHKQELMKRTEKENLYNNFKKQLSERYIHKNLTIDAISKISNKLAFYGRRYFIKNYNYDFIGDKDFLFQNEMLLNLGHKHHKKERYYKVKNSCENVIYNINKLAKNKMRIMKRLNDDREKYNDKKNGYFFITDDAGKNKDKDLIKKTMTISRNENENNYTNNYSYEEFMNKNSKEINEILLPKVNFTKNGMSFDEF